MFDKLRWIQDFFTQRKIQNIIFNRSNSHSTFTIQAEVVWKQIAGSHNN